MLKVGDKQVLLDVLCTSHALVQGASGSGKSYLIRVLAEQSCSQIQTIIIDPEGEYHTLREKYPFVLVGEGGETPASTKTAELLARRLVEVGASAICDLYALEREDQEEWVRLFLTALMKLPRDQWKPMLVIIDEAHLFVPEKGEGSAGSTRAVEDFCSRARKHGIGIILATQRITKVSNNAAGNLQNYFIGRTFIQVDRERAAKVMGVPNRQAEKEAFFNDLKVLKPGQFWILGVAVSVDRALVHVQQAETTHPKAGAIATHKPVAPDQIRAMLPQLADLPKEAEKAEADIEALRMELATVNTLLAKASYDLNLSVNENMLLRSELENQKPTVLLLNVNGIRERLEKFDAEVAFENKIEEVCRELRSSFRALSEGIEADLQAVEEVPAPLPRPGTVEADIGRIEAGLLKSKQKIEELTANLITAHDKLSGPQRDYLMHLAKFASIGRHSPSMAWIAAAMGTTARARGFEENTRALRNKGYIETGDGEVRLTAQGRAFVGHVQPLKGHELLNGVHSVLSGPQWAYLELLINLRRKPLTLERLAEQFNTTVRARGFEENIRFLRNNEMIVTTSGAVVAADWLFV